MNPSELVGVAEIAERASVSSQAVVNWCQRYEDFPEPVVTLKSGKVWVWSQIEQWLEATGRKST